MVRYDKFNKIILALSLSKLSVYSQSLVPALKDLNVKAGHFRLNSFYVEHGLILFEITGYKPQVERYVHGKRNRHTVLLNSNLNNTIVFLDKFINYNLPSMEDLYPFQSRQLSSKISQYSWRVRKYFSGEEFDVFVTDRLLKKEVFLPLFINFSLSSKSNHRNQIYLRILRIPFSTFKFLTSEKF